jgi:hypothetical protein
MINKEKIQLKGLTRTVEKIRMPGDDKVSAPPPKEANREAPLPGEKEEERFIVRLKVFNPENRTLYAYGEARRIRYDKATGKLSLGLHDGHVDENSPIAIHLTRPKFVPLEANAETEIKLALPRSINRLRSAAERAGGPLFEKLDIENAKEIEVEIGHQDTPFYYNPKETMAKQLKEWAKPVTKSVFKLDPAPKNKS